MSKLKGIISIYDTHTIFQKPNFETGKLGVPKNMTLASIRKIFKLDLEYGNNKFMRFKDGIIPDNVVNFDAFKEEIIFYTKPDYRKLFFKTHLKIEDNFYKIPYLLWVYKNKNLKVFALKTKIKSSKDILYNAPFMNVSSNGSVCMGNVKYGNESEFFDLLMEDIIDKFFNSYFTHTNNSNLLKMNYSTFLEKHANDKNLSYSGLLVQSNCKLKEILKDDFN